MKENYKNKLGNEVFNTIIKNRIMHPIKFELTGSQWQFISLIISHSVAGQKINSTKNKLKCLQVKYWLSRMN